MEGNKETPGERPVRFPGWAGRARPNLARRADAGVVIATRRDRRLAGAAVDHHCRSGDDLWDLHGDVCPVPHEVAACLADRREHGQDSAAFLPDITRDFAVALCFQRAGRLAADVGHGRALLVASLGVMVAVLASLGPIVAFFSVSTTSYPFMLLFNVVVCSVSGALGLSFLLQTLHRLSILDSQTSRHTDRRGRPRGG